MNTDNNDHDLLISINAKITALNTQFRDTMIQNKEEHARINDRLETILNNKLNAKVFWWVVPFIIGGLISVASLASNNQYEIGKNQKSIEMHIDK